MENVEQLKRLVGKEGITLSTLRPSGYVLIEGELYDCQGEQSKITEKGVTVEVTGILMNRFLHVREVN
ncbi:MAG: NfeD family protein [Bacteroidota bacterium]